MNANNNNNSMCKGQCNIIGNKQDGENEMATNILHENIDGYMLKGIDFHTWYFHS